MPHHGLREHRTRPELTHSSVPQSISTQVQLQAALQVGRDSGVVLDHGEPNAVGRGLQDPLSASRCHAVVEDNDRVVEARVEPLPKQRKRALEVCEKALPVSDQIMQDGSVRTLRILASVFRLLTETPAVRREALANTKARQATAAILRLQQVLLAPLIGHVVKLPRVPRLRTAPARSGGCTAGGGGAARIWTRTRCGKCRTARPFGHSNGQRQVMFPNEVTQALALVVGRSASVVQHRQAFGRAPLQAEECRSDGRAKPAA
mmetsp:Transcript_125472/g.401256  ORF Transcript_125472/g.401256 Transcript_125472/m.401256 type:complete len:262 (+) Transcript_125472:1159-1944(+)